MEGNESDQFESADEGLEKTESDNKCYNAIEKPLPHKEVNSPIVERGDTSRPIELKADTSGNADTHDQPKAHVVSKKKKTKKKKQLNSATRQCSEIMERLPVCQSSKSDGRIQPDSTPSSSKEATAYISSPVNHKTLPEGSNVKSEDVNEHDSNRKHAGISRLKPDVSLVEQPPESHETNLGGIWDPDALSSAASSLLRNVGGGISSLAGALGQVLSTTEPDEDAEERRRRRKAEEENDLRSTLGAWSDVWNAAWGDNSENDGWELDDSVFPVESQQSETQEEGAEDFETSCSPSTQDIKDTPSDQSMEQWSWTGVSSFAHSLKTSFQEKSRSLVQESVGVLEKIGRKTMSVLEENDPGFRYTKKIIRPPRLNNQPSLSQVIHEAREQSKVQESLGGADESRALQNRGDLNYQLEASRGLVHLEALELVSYQAESRLHTHLTNASSLHDGPLQTIWETLSFEDDEQLQKDWENDEFINDEAKRLTLADIDPDAEENNDLPLPKDDVQSWIVLQRILTQLKIVYSGQKLSNILTSCLRNALSPKDEDVTSEEQFFTVISTLTEMTSGNLEYLHKLAECLLIRTHEPNTDFLQISELIRLFLLVSMKLKSKVCKQFVNLVKKARNPPPEVGGKLASTSHLIANILIECGNAQCHLKNAARLLIPVLQLAYLTKLVNLDESA